MSQYGPLMTSAPGRARRSDARRNRTAILEAAARALRSADDLQLREVADAAGVSRSTLHRHFSSRAALEEELRAAAVAELRRTIAEALTGERPPLAVLRRLVLGLVRVATERRLDRLGGLRAAESRDELAAALVPALERLRQAAEIVPAPPAGWQRQACAHFLEACLDLSGRPDAPAAAEGLFHSLTDPLDRGLVVLDERGALLCLNPRAAELVAPAGRLEVGGRLTEPRAELLYEDGSPAPDDAYLLAAQLRTQQQRVAVRGHGRPVGQVKWVAVAAQPLRSRAGGLYGVLGVLRDVTVEPAGAAGHGARRPARHRACARRDPTAPLPGAVRRRGAPGERQPGGPLRARHRWHPPAAPGGAGGVPGAARRSARTRAGASRGRGPGP